MVVLADLGAVSASRQTWASEMLGKQRQSVSGKESKTSFPFTPLAPLGYHLAQMPVDLRLGKMLIYACMFNCLG